MPPADMSPDIFSGRFVLLDVLSPDVLSVHLLNCTAAYTSERNALDTGAYANVKKHQGFLTCPVPTFFYLKYLYNQVRL
jgi:hypothetical protein